MGFKDINIVCPQKLPTENVLLKKFHFNFSTLVQLVHKWVHCLPIISDYFVLVLKRLFPAALSPHKAEEVDCQHFNANFCDQRTERLYVSAF